MHFLSSLHKLFVFPLSFARSSIDFSSPSPRTLSFSFSSSLPHQTHFPSSFRLPPHHSKFPTSFPPLRSYIGSIVPTPFLSSSNKDRLYQSHRVRNMIDTVTSTTHKLIEIYEDNDYARKDEIAALGGQTATGINVFSAFYDRLKEIREYHRKHPVARVVDAIDDYEALLKEEP